MPAAFAIATQTNQVEQYATERALHEPEMDPAFEHGALVTRPHRTEQCDLGLLYAPFNGSGMRL